MYLAVNHDETDGRVRSMEAGVRRSYVRLLFRLAKVIPPNSESRKQGNSCRAAPLFSVSGS